MFGIVIQGQTSSGLLMIHLNAGVMERHVHYLTILVRNVAMEILFGQTSVFRKHVVKCHASKMERHVALAVHVTAAAIEIPIGMALRHKNAVKSHAMAMERHVPLAYLVTAAAMEIHFGRAQGCKNAVTSHAGVVTHIVGPALNAAMDFVGNRVGTFLGSSVIKLRVNAS